MSILDKTSECALKVIDSITVAWQNFTFKLTPYPNNQVFCVRMKDFLTDILQRVQVCHANSDKQRSVWFEIDFCELSFIHCIHFFAVQPIVIAHKQWTSLRQDISNFTMGECIPLGFQEKSIHVKTDLRRVK